MLTSAPISAATGDQSDDQPIDDRVSRAEILAFIAHIWPRELIDCPKLRIGGDHDGGYVLPATALLCERLLSIGIGNNMQFDVELAEFGLKILQFDHTIRFPPAFHESCHFLRFGLGRTRTDTLLTFTDMVTIFDTIARGPAILKFDIEGAEYDSFIDVPDTTIAEFDVIVCEYHNLHRLEDHRFHTQALAVARRFANHHVAVHLHPNNYGTTHDIHGIPLPDVVEITYIHRKFANTGDLSIPPIPGFPDFPNNPHAPDPTLYPPGAATNALIESLRAAIAHS